ncbi:MAG: 5'-methylthioadenosine/S-adenosylhomocysteine nucleosidase [Bacilli bacterium]
MRIGIIFAMEIEKKAFLDMKKNIVFNHDIFIYQSGIGKVNAATTTSNAILLDKCELIINCGVAGGINTANLLDVYYGVEFKYSDVDLSCFTNYEIGQIPKMPVYYQGVNNSFTFSKAISGKIASQDTFATSKQKEMFKNYFSDYIAVDMESCAIAQACYSYNIDFIAIRAISDLVFKDENYINYEESENLACKEAAQALYELLVQI